MIEKGLTVYEIIQELAQFDPDMEVKVVVTGKPKLYVDIPEEEDVDEDRNMLLPVEIEENSSRYFFNRAGCDPNMVFLEVEL